MQDSELVLEAMAGDAAAFEQIILNHQKAVYGYLRARLLQANDAEDLTQDVFLRFYVNRERFDPEQLLRPWLMGIARNLLREHVRKIRRRKEVAWTNLCLELEDTFQVEDDGMYDDVLVHLSGCLESLGPSAREAVDLRYRNNLRLSAIGKKLKRSEGAIKLLMFRARQALKMCLTGKLRSSPND